jgi:hypothetical protein
MADESKTKATVAVSYVLVLIGSRVSLQKKAKRAVGRVLTWILVAYLFLICFLICAPACETWKHGLVGYKGSLSVVAKTGVVDGPFSKLVEIGSATNKIEDILRIVRHASDFRLQLRDFARKEHIALLSRWPATVFSTGHQFFAISAMSLHGLVHFFCGAYILNCHWKERRAGPGRGRNF